MSKFQILIIDQKQTVGDEKEEAFAVEQHGRGGSKIVDNIDNLGEVWEIAIEKLTDLASKSLKVSDSSQYELTDIEFNIGIEAGFSVGLVTKGDASVSIKFSRKQGDQ